MSIAPIGVFDSGVGGLQLVRNLSRHLPEESIYFLADNLRMPYGNRDPKELVSLALQACSILERLGCKMVVIACNTISSVALEAIKSTLSVPVIGMIDSCSREAKLSSKSNVIGLIATPVTINSQKYQSLLNPITLVTSQAPDIAPLIEWGKPLEEKLSHYLNPLKQSSIDTLILGCTHYPFIQNLIQQQMGPEVRLIDSTTTCMDEIKETLVTLGLQAPKECVGTLQFFATNPHESFNWFIRQLFGSKAKNSLTVSF